MSGPARPPEGRAPSLGEAVAQRQEGTSSGAPARPPEGRAPSLGEAVAQRQEGTSSGAPARPREGRAPSLGEEVAQRQDDTPRNRALLSRTGLLWAVATPPVLLLLVFFVLPLAYLFFVSFMTNSQTALYDLAPTLRNYVEVATDPFYLLIIQRTLLATGVVLIACLLLGYPVALYASRLPPRGRMIMLLLMMFPLMVSNVVRAYGWVSILGRTGILSVTLREAGLTDRPIQFLYSFDAVVVGLLTILLPFMVVSITNSLTAIDQRYTEAAQSLGAGPWQTFFRVTLPLSSPGVTSGLMLVTFLMLSAYVTIALLGGPRFKLLVSLVFDSAATFRWPRAAALSFVLLAIALVIAAAIQIVMRPQRVQGKGT